MNWVVFAIVSWILLGCEIGLRDALQLGSSSIAPSFLIPLIVYIALWARTNTALTAALALGITLDLLNTWPTESNEDLVIVGPWAFGCMLAAYTALNFRTMMLRKSPVTAAILCVICAGVAQVVSLAIITFRSSYDEIVLPSAAAELWPRLASALYTGALALVITPALQFISPWFGLRRTAGPAGGLRFP